MVVRKADALTDELRDDAWHPKIVNIDQKLSKRHSLQTNLKIRDSLDHPWKIISIVKRAFKTRLKQTHQWVRYRGKLRNI
jgi:hypothetical protein